MTNNSSDAVASTVSIASVDSVVSPISLDSAGVEVITSTETEPDVVGVETVE